MKKFLAALKIGYKVLQVLEGLGFNPKIHDIPLSKIEQGIKQVLEYRTNTTPAQ